MKASASILMQTLIAVFAGSTRLAEAQPSASTPESTFQFVSADSSPCGVGVIVKGAPYSAESVTEVTHVLGDGNRIVRKSRALVYRDSEGRKRVDRTVSNIGSLESSGCKCQTVSIMDPVAHVHYTMDEVSKTVRRHELQNPKNVGMTSAAQQPCDGLGRPSRGTESAESLGTRVIEGVRTEGTRTTVTIPASEVGSEKPIVIVSERWYSPELQIYILTKRSDPRFGETVHRLTNLSRQEPSRELFEVPRGYAVREHSPGHRWHANE